MTGMVSFDAHEVFKSPENEFAHGVVPQFDVFIRHLLDKANTKEEILEAKALIEKLFAIYQSDLPKLLTALWAVDKDLFSCLQRLGLNPEQYIVSKN